MSALQRMPPLTTAAGVTLASWTLAALVLGDYRGKYPASENWWVVLQRTRGACAAGGLAACCAGRRGTHHVQTAQPGTQGATAFQCASGRRCAATPAAAGSRPCWGLCFLLSSPRRRRGPYLPPPPSPPSGAHASPALQGATWIVLSSTRLFQGS